MYKVLIISTRSIFSFQNISVSKKGAFNNFANRKCWWTCLHQRMVLQKLMTVHILNIYSWFYVAISLYKTDIGVWPFSKNLLTYYTPKYQIMDTGNDLVSMTYFAMNCMKSYDYLFKFCENETLSYSPNPAIQLKVSEKNSFK